VGPPTEIGFKVFRVEENRLAGVDAGGAAKQLEIEVNNFMKKTLGIKILHQSLAVLPLLGSNNPSLALSGTVGEILVLTLIYVEVKRPTGR